MTGAKLKTKRTNAGITGICLATAAGVSRSYLSGIERSYVTPRAEELRRIDAVLDGLILTKGILQQTAAELGWPVTI